MDVPFTTQLPNGAISLDGNGLPVVDTNFLSVLNTLGPSTEFTDYNVPGDQGPTTLTNGDEFNIVNDDGAGTISNVDSGTYLGDFTLSTANVSANLLGLAGVTVSLNPIQGELYQDENDNFFMISDQPLTEDHIGITIEVDTILGGVTSVDLNLSDPLDDVPVVGDAVAPLVQQLLDTAAVTFEVDTNGTLTFNDTDLICFTSGTLIKTIRGEIPVEDLKLGDEVLTLDRGYQTIRWIGSRNLSAAQLADHPKMCPIRIRAGALGVNQPERDLLVSPQHRILVRSIIAERMFGQSEVLVAAKQLLEMDGVEIAEDVTSITYWHFMFEAHQIVFANGAATESLYTGSEALKAVGNAARQEILDLFPELDKEDLHVAQPARILVPGRRGRRLAERVMRNKKTLVAEQV